MRKVKGTFIGGSSDKHPLVNDWTYNFTILYLEEAKITILVKSDKDMKYETTYSTILEFLDNWANISKIGDIEQGIQADTGDSSATNN